MIRLHAQATAKINAGRQHDCDCAVESLLKRVFKGSKSVIAVRVAGA
jgi:hypothetical protein